MGQPVRVQCWAWVWLWKTRVGVRGWTLLRLPGSLFASRSDLFYNQLLKVEGPYPLCSGVFLQLPQLAPPARPVCPHRPPPPSAQPPALARSLTPLLSITHMQQTLSVPEERPNPRHDEQFVRAAVHPAPFCTHTAHLAFGRPTYLLKTKAQRGLTLSQKDPTHHMIPPAPRLWGSWVSN